MAIPKLNSCPGTLKNGFSSYSPGCLRNVFNGRKVSHVLDLYPPDSDEGDGDLLEENQGRISISGVQEKYSMVLEKNKLRLTRQGERGEYILKPVPSRGRYSDQMPANEHLTMQIATQVFDMEVAPNALIFFKDGSPAYITKRFDKAEDGTRLAMEDFASLRGMTPQTHGKDYKYQGNYLELFKTMRRNLPAYSVEAVKLYEILIFNYLFSNGDAHLKNFSIIETELGDYRLSPAYDLICTRMHIKGSYFALDQGLLSPALSSGKVLQQFLKLGEEAEIKKIMVDRSLEKFEAANEAVEEIIHRSFLSNPKQRQYQQLYQEKFSKLFKR